MLNLFLAGCFPTQELTQLAKKQDSYYGVQINQAVNNTNYYTYWCANWSAVVTQFLKQQNNQFTQNFIDNPLFLYEMGIRARIQKTNPFSTDELSLYWVDDYQKEHFPIEGVASSTDTTLFFVSKK